MLRRTLFAGTAALAVMLAGAQAQAQIRIATVGPMTGSYAAVGAQVAGMRDYDRTRDHVFHLFPRLKERLTQRGGTLSGGEQQMLAIGRALMSQPRLLLLDEPSLGLAPLVVRGIFGAIRDLNRETGLTVLLVEQNAYQALRLAHRGYVLVNGSITMAGPGRELMTRPEIRAAYLEGAH